MPTQSLIAVAFLAWAASLAKAETTAIVIQKTPNEGIQPQAVVDAKGTLHLIYFKGNTGQGDVFYINKARDQREFSTPIRVNSQSGSVVAIGTIRGAQLAVGKNGRVHVAWNGSHVARPRGPNNGTPMLYARLADSGKEFEEQRNMMQQTYILDGGGSVAADATGNVYVAWHARKVGSTDGGEQHRRVWVAKSADDGATFAIEDVASAEPTGACGCCGMRAFADSKGAVHLLYRAATATVNRGMYLLTSTNRARSFQSVQLQPWKIKTCPMSSEAFAEGHGKLFAAWETEDQVYFATLRPGADGASKPANPPGEAVKRKHPALAVGASGEMLIVWTERTGWNQGGDLAWQKFDAEGRPTGESGRKENAIGVWGLPAVVANADGGFTIFH